MELQALRYAAMISTMTFDQAVEVYAGYLKKLGREADARTLLLEFLDWDQPDDEPFAQDVRIVLASAEFSKELTTSVMWLNERGLDIRCIRIKPYKDNGRVLVDVQQVIPLPEATEYQVQIKEKQQQERESRKSSKDYTKYDVVINGELHGRLYKRQTVFLVVKHLCDTGASPEAVSKAVPWMRRPLFRVVDGDVNSQEFVSRQVAGGAGFDKARYFCEDGELIHCSGKTYALTNQWGVQAIDLIKDLLNAFPDKQITCTPSPF